MAVRNGKDSHRGNKSNGSLHIDYSQKFEGASRVAYRARVWNGCIGGFTEGTYGVIKRFKQSYVERGYTVSEKDVEMQQQVRMLAEEFNSITPSHYPEIVVRDSTIVTLSQSNERVFFEREIAGQWEKFNSNNGWTAGDEYLDAFSHWTWHQSQEDFLVCDLQGHRGRRGGPTYLHSTNYYMLTDPCINSKDHQFGINDVGMSGIKSFFENHRCGHVCKQLGLHGHRIRRDLVEHVPVLPMKRSTSYSLDNGFSSSYSNSMGSRVIRHIRSPGFTAVKEEDFSSDSSDYDYAMKSPGRDEYFACSDYRCDRRFYVSNYSSEEKALMARAQHERATHFPLYECEYCDAQFDAKVYGSGSKALHACTQHERDAHSNGCYY